MALKMHSNVKLYNTEGVSWQVFYESYKVQLIAVLRVPQPVGIMVLSQGQGVISMVILDVL